MASPTAIQSSLSELMAMVQQKQAAVAALNSRRAAAAAAAAAAATVSSSLPDHKRARDSDTTTTNTAFVDTRDVFGSAAFAPDASRASGSFSLSAQEEDEDIEMPAQQPAASRRKAGRKPGARGSKATASDDLDDDPPPKPARNGRPPPQSEKKRREQNRAAQKAWRERKERHLQELEEKVKLYEASNGALEPLFQENAMLKQMVESLQQENDRLRETSFTFVPPAAGLPGTSPSASNFSLPTGAPDIFANAIPSPGLRPAKRSPPPGDYDTGYSSGNMGSPSESESSSTITAQAALQLADVLKDMDPESAKQLLVGLLDQQRIATGNAASTLPADIAAMASIQQQQQQQAAAQQVFASPEEIDRLVADITASNPSIPVATSTSSFSSSTTTGPEWNIFDPQVVELMSAILPQATDDYQDLAPYLNLSQPFSPIEPLNFDAILAPQAPIGIGIPDADAAVFGSSFLSQPLSQPTLQQQSDEMDWSKFIEPTKMSYKQALPMLAAVKPPELRLPQSAVKILRELDVNRVPCSLLRGKLAALKEKYMHTDVATISDSDFNRMMRMRISAMAKAMGKPKLSLEEEQLLVEMMTSKATIETHAEQLAGALEEIRVMAENPEKEVECETIKRVKAAFAVCPNAGKESEDAVDCA